MKKFLTIVIALVCILSMTGCAISFDLNKTDGNSSEGKTNSQLDGTQYIAGDESYLVLGLNDTENNFNWYQTQNNLKDNYYSGRYVAYFNEDAAKFIVKNKACYGVTEEELSRVTKGDYSKLVVLYVNYSEIMIDGESKLAEFNNSIDKDNPKTVTYYGEIDDKGNLNLVNMMSANVLAFTKIQDTQQVEEIPEEENSDNISTSDDFTDPVDELQSNSESVKSETEALNKIKIDIPKNYTLINSTDTYLLYLDYANDKGITIFFYEGEKSLKYAKQHKDGQDIKVDGHDAYRYVDDGDYYCSILGNGGEYIIEAEDEAVLENILKTMKL